MSISDVRIAPLTNELPVNNNHKSSSDTYNHDAAIKTLQAQFGDKLSTNLTVREQHGHTMTWLANQPPDAVLTAQDKHDVAKAVAICNEYKMPVIAFGVGSSLEGQLNAPYGGLCIDMHALDAILQVNNEDLTVTVQPGVTREQLNHYLRDTGLFFPIDPGANASIGCYSCLRHQCSTLWHDEGCGARARSSDSEWRHYSHGDACKKICCGL